MTQHKKELILFSLFITSMVLVNTIGTKIIALFSIRVSVGIFFMPILFLITDIVGEVKGKAEALFFVKVATGMLLFLFCMVALCVKIPPYSGYSYQKEYALIFGSTLRMTIASLISFMISQNLDVVLFDKIGAACGGRYLWIRNNTATMTSQLIDTIVFDFIAFYHLTPQFDVPFLISLILPYWMFKVLFAAMDTPFCYLGVRWLKGEKPFKENQLATAVSC
ncbi:MAG: queuosine precursor transporter [Spirochaetia bacterium]|jgi:uncharacterized integral membrane protein (TIGR00697 family)|nr:queuosine precursor transporter [Spirochaetia bacterium]